MFIISVEGKPKKFLLYGSVSAAPSKSESEDLIQQFLALV